MDTATLLSQLKTISCEAGNAIMEIYNQDFEVFEKDDKSPLTLADRKAHQIICNALETLDPSTPILSEEGDHADYATRSSWTRYWCIDPLDGTKEFIKKNGEFTVNIALIENGAPVLGVVYAPALNLLYWGASNEGAYKQLNTESPQPIKVKTQDIDRLCVVVSRSHMSDETTDWINTHKLETQQLETIPTGSSLKLCFVAEGKADVYPRLGPTMEWDTAAAHAVVSAAGGTVLNYETNSALQYNKENLLNPWFICHSQG